MNNCTAPPEHRCAEIKREGRGRKGREKYGFSIGIQYYEPRPLKPRWKAGIHVAVRATRGEDVV